jgi:hypothetical protein
MSPTDGELGKFTVNAPPEVLQKYPFPLSAVNVAVLIDPVCQFTEPPLPKPD